MRTYDVAVVGLGIMGSAALYNLSRRGLKVVGFDPLILGEKRGSSHGTSRIYRRYNFESAAYTALGTRAHEGWLQLQEETGQTILMPSMLVEAGKPGSVLVRGSLAAAARPPGSPAHGADLNRRFPQFRLPDDWDVVVRDEAGILLADVALRAFRERAVATIVSEPVTVARTAQEIIVTAGDGIRYEARQLVLAAGPWITDFVPQLKDFITITRQTVGWFAPAVPERTKYPDFPLFILEAPAGVIYGFADFEGRGVKAASHDLGRRLPHADDARQDAMEDELRPVLETLKTFIPAAGGALVAEEVCLYTNTAADDADGSKPGEFILDRLPYDDRVIVVSACSGHGFKFAGAIGEIVAGMAVDGSASGGKDFSLRRFSPFAGNRSG